MPRASQEIQKESMTGERGCRVELRSPLNSQNERLYREIEFKADLSEDEILVAPRYTAAGCDCDGSCELVWKVLFVLQYSPVFLRRVFLTSREFISEFIS